MAKGLGITLAVIAFALAGMTGAQAYAPVMGNIPDVTIGDQEDNLTMDMNIFRATDAFDFRDFVLDWDTPTTSILWSFAIAGAPPFIPKVNNKDDLNAPGAGSGTTPVNPSPLRRLTDPVKGLYTATPSVFIFFPPGPPPPAGPPYPSPIVPKGSRTMTYYASDGTRADSKTVMLYYVDNGTDSVSYSVTAIGSATYNFASTPPGSEFAPTTAAPTGLALGTYGTTGGSSLSIQVGGSAASPNGGFFGRWNTPTVARDGIIKQVIPYYANSLYRVRSALRTTQANPILFPAYRVNAFNDFFTQVYEASLAPIVLAEAMEGLYLSASARNVDLYIQLPDDLSTFSALVGAGYDGRTMAVGWDLLDLNGQPGGGQEAIGTVFLDSIQVDRFPQPESNPEGPFEVISRPADVMVNNAGFPVGPSTWQRTNNPDGSVTMHVQGTSTAPAGAKVGLLELPFGYGSLLWREASYVQDRQVLIRAKYRLSVPATATRAQWVNFRLRWGAELGNFGGLVGLQRGNGIDPIHLAVVPPLATSGTADYNMVFSMPPAPQWMVDDPLSIIGHPPSFFLAFDGVNNTGVPNATTDGGTATLHSIEVEAMPVPQD